MPKFVEFVGVRNDRLQFRMNGKTYLSSRIVSHEMETVVDPTGKVVDVHVITTVSGSKYVYGITKVNDATIVQSSRMSDAQQVAKTCWGTTKSVVSTLWRVGKGAYQGARAAK